MSTPDYAAETDQPIARIVQDTRDTGVLNDGAPDQGKGHQDTRDTGHGEDLLSGVRDGTWLGAQTFPPLRYSVPGVVPEGLTLLVGPPKAGKSWLALAVLLAVASGGRALGKLRVGAPRRVLYLALEDEIGRAHV